MITIHKYPFKVASEVVIAMPKYADVLKVDTQAGIPCIWALVNTNEETHPLEERSFRVVGTGHPIDPDEVRRLVHIDTFQEMNGALVWHLFEWQ